MLITSFSGNSGGLKSFLSLLSFIVIFILILVFAYFATKLIAKYQNNVLNAKSNIRIMESFRLGNNKFIAIVKIGESFYAIALGKDEVTLLDKLDSNELKIPSEFMKQDPGIDKFEENSVSKKIDFKDILSQVKKNK